MAASTQTAVQPVQYQIGISADLVRSDFTGRVTIRLFAPQPVDTLEFNVLELAVRRCTCMIGEQARPCPFRVNPAAETLQIELPEPVSGDLEVQIDYHGEINHSMAGFYRSQYTVQGEIRPIAVTQFQESDARRAFPCLDHPLYKASFEVALTIDETLAALSNMPVQQQKALGDGRKTVCFEKTPQMATYLLFFGLGAFEIRSGESDARVRIALLPGMSDDTAYGLQFGEKALAYCENFFGIAYPLPKLDLIAVPDFAFGAMENWGAITFRENLLLYDPAITSSEAQERICEVIAHEIVHQWFGNLVTPSDWRYLWLNESFATYFGFGVVAHYHPDWQIWEEFLSSQTAPAMARDGLTDTSAIEIPSGSHMVINSSTAPIIYSKGASVLRQIEGYLGEKAFREGLHDYLNRHAYACAASQDLWTALEAISGKPVSHIMQAWVETPGHPMITARRSGSRLTLRQQRFTYLAGSDPALWPIPLLIRVFEADGTSRLITEMMTEKEMVIDMGTEAAGYKINDGQTGFYRVAYEDPENFETLCRLVRREELPGVERWGIENDFFAFVKSRRYGIDQYLQLLGEYRAETHPLALSAIFDHLAELLLLLPPAKGEKITDLARPWISETVQRLGLSPAANEPHGLLRLRRQALRLSAFFDIPGILTLGGEAFGKLMDGQPLHPDIREAVMQLGAWNSGETAFNWLIQQIAAAASEQDRINALRALGCFNETGQIEKALDYALNNTPDRNKFIPVAMMAQNPAAVPLLWDWYTNHHEDLAGVHPLIHERIIGAVVPFGGLDRREAVRSFCDARFKETDAAAPVIRMALEKLDIHQQLRDARAV